MTTKTRPAKPLTVQQATREARRHVDRIMPGIMATVDSRLSHDLESDTPLVVTTVTFPVAADGQLKLLRALDSLAGVIDYTWADSSIVITRSR